MPKQIKTQEYRVGLTPGGVRELVAAGHQVYIQASAGTAIGTTDEHYQNAGAEVVPNAEDLFNFANLIVKVK